ncbi:hypothetical protein [Clostridioides sp. ZZV14-6387]|uniref:hypothetical protein n=1 Tax=Clostridioides sp. ZZV14-6387 TaxID=2811497 RepID=UPI001D12D415|nr:hypothetical protein [Clostridioides sp. ZZV14-6387]
MLKQKIRIYLSNVNDKDKICMELLEKLNKLQVDEGEAIEIIAPRNFNLSNICLEQKMQISQKLLELRVVFKFVSNKS